MSDLKTSDLIPRNMEKVKWDRTSTGMNSLPGTFLQRELGWNRTPRQVVDYTSQLSTLSYNEDEDRISLIKQMKENPDWEGDGRPAFNPVYNMEFSPHTRNIVAVTDEVGAIALIDTHQRNREKVLAYHRCIQNAIFKVSWSPHRQGVIATASCNQTVDIWDVNGFKCLATYRGHSKTVKTVKFHPTRTDVIASAGRDGCIMIWDLRIHSSAKPENLISNAHCVMFKTGSNKRKFAELSLPVTDIILRDDHTLISCGATDGLIKFWDLRRTYKYLTTVDPVKVLKYPSNQRAVGFSGMCMDSTNNLYTSTSTRDIFKFDLSSDSDLPVQNYARHSTTDSDYSMNLDISGDGRYLISASRDAYAYIWDTWGESEQPCARLEDMDEHNSLCCALFNPDNTLEVVTGGDDSLVTIWRSDPLQINKKQNNRNLHAESQLSLGVSIPPHGRQDRHNYILPKYHRSLPYVSRGLDISSPFDLAPLLEDLPNFVINGIQPHVTPKVDKCFTPDRRDLTAWLNGDVVSGEKRLRRDSNESATPSKRLKVKNCMTPTPPSKKPKPSPRSTKSTTPKSRTTTNRRRLALSATSPANQNMSPVVNTNAPSILKYFTPIINVTPTVDIVRLPAQ